MRNADVMNLILTDLGFINVDANTSKFLNVLMETSKRRITDEGISLSSVTLSFEISYSEGDAEADNRIYSLAVGTHRLVYDGEAWAEGETEVDITALGIVLSVEPIEGASLTIDIVETGDIEPDDAVLISMYASYLYRKRMTNEPMPRMLRYALNNRLMKEKMQNG